MNDAKLNKSGVQDPDELDFDQAYFRNKRLPRTDAEFQYTPEMIAEIQKCRESILYFAENYFYITDIDEGQQKIKLYPAQRRVLRALERHRFNVICASRQVGKALALDTKIPTPKGWTTMGDIKDKDQIYGTDGKIYNVVKAHDIMYDRDCYEIVFDNNQKVTADKGHRWFTQDRKERNHGVIGSVKTTEELFKTLYASGTKEPNHRIQKAKAVEGIEQELPIDPYLLGVWLGDGACAAPVISIGKEDIENMIQTLNQPYYTLRKDRAGNYFYRIKGENRKKTTDCLQKQLRALNVLNNKHIPEIYLNASRQQRIELLRGLMDTDGYVTKVGVCQFYSSFPALAETARRLILSLGFKVTSKTYTPYYKTKCKDMTSLTFTPDLVVFKLERKKARQVAKSISRTNYHYIKQINKVSSVPVRCITVDSPNSLFLCGEQYIPTSNTTLMCIFALWLTCFEASKRVVIIANKEGTAIIILRRIAMAYEELPNWLKPGVAQYGKKEAIFGNRSSIAISTTTGSAVRGDTVNCIIIDEMAHIEDTLIQEFWASVIPTISSSRKRTTKIFAVSTPKGNSNMFYKIYTDAEKGKLDDTGSISWHPEKIYWNDVPGRGALWKRDMINALGGDKQLWMQEFENSFIESGEGAVDGEMLDNLEKNCKAPIQLFEDGHYKVWKLPQRGHIYGIGVDVGEGIGRASSTAVVLDFTDLTNIVQVAEFADNKIHPLQFADMLSRIGAFWGNPPMLIERNNIGGEVIDSLIETHHYTNVVTFSPRYDSQDYERPGVYSNSHVKLNGVTNMRYWLNTLKVVSINSLNLVGELKTFVRFPNGTWKKKNGDNIYDDRVMAFLWCLFLLFDTVVERYYDIVERDDVGKPLRLAAYSIQQPGIFKLDRFFQKVPDAPLPSFIGLSPESYDDINMQSLNNNGWSRMK